MSASVVPARAGMSPVWGVFLDLTFSGPRASGDEPAADRMRCTHYRWSPRERG